MKMEKELKPLLLTITLAGSAGPIVRPARLSRDTQGFGETFGHHVGSHSGSEEH